MNEKKKYYTINEPDELVKFINNNLSPKELEKNENGEVFTPLSLVNEMLDKLDEGYNKEHNKSIFADSSLKWFDPAVGIGNFPVVVYLRLMDGLKPVIKNDEKRRKHILENMLYMSELTPKNVFICKKIFCSNTYKLNINEGDS
jgi:predicted helicase